MEFTLTLHVSHKTGQDFPLNFHVSIQGTFTYESNNIIISMGHFFGWHLKHEGWSLNFFKLRLECMNNWKKVGSEEIWKKESALLKWNFMKIYKLERMITFIDQPRYSSFTIIYHIYWQIRGII